MADTRNQPGKQGEREELERQRREQGGDVQDPNRRAGQNPRRGQEEHRQPGTGTETERDTGTTEGDVEKDPGRQNAG